MKIAAKKSTEMSGECDMTPMIDMTFQLIIFLMLIVNFTEVDQNAAVKLPSSELAKPADKPLEKFITLNVLESGRVIIGGQTVEIEGLKALMGREAQNLIAEGRQESDATIVVRGHAEAPTGKIQEVIKACQEARFEKFALRAQEET